MNGAVHGRKLLGKRNMNAAGQIAVTLAALIGFGRLFLADEGESHRLIEPLVRGIGGQVVDGALVHRLAEPREAVGWARLVACCHVIPLFD